MTFRQLLAKPWLILAAVILVTHGISFWIYFDDETLRFFVLPREGQFYFPGCLWGNWINLPVASQTYRPLMTLSFLLNYAVFGAAPWGYHLTNLGMHALAVALVYRVAALLKPGSNLYPLLTALVFGVHPLTTQPLWILGDRAEVAVFIFTALALLLFFRASKRRLSVFLSLLSFALALTSKETAITLPLLLILFDFGFESQRYRSVAGLVSRLVAHAPYWLVLGGYLIGRSLLFSGLGGYRSHSHILFDYVGPILCQNLDWLFVLPFGAWVSCLVYPVVILVSLSAYRRREVFIGIAWLLITLLPTLNLCQKWYLYIPLVGWSFAIGGFLSAGIGKLGRKWAPVLSSLIVLPLALGSYAELLQQKRNTDGAWAIARSIHRQIETITPSTEIRLLLPRGVKLTDIHGHFFKPDTFLVEKNPSPLRGIVKDLNQTRYLGDQVIYSRLVPSILKLLFATDSLKIKVVEADDRSLVEPKTTVITMQWQPSLKAWIRTP